jgi:hypothetical protein
VFIHHTGAPDYTYITASAINVYGPGKAKGAEGYTLKVTGPGGEHVSELSGPGLADSKFGGGDNHYMNMKVEFPPYTPGVYRAIIFHGDAQITPEIELNLSASPLIYAHIECLLQQ